MSGALGWWRHAAVAGAVAGLLASPYLAPPAGWLLCLLASSLALAALGSRMFRDDRHDRARGRRALPAAGWLASLLALGALAGLGAGGARIDAIDAGALSGPVGARVEVDGFVAGVARRSFGEVRVPLDSDAGRLVVVAPEPVDDLPVGRAIRADGRLVRPGDPFGQAELERLGAALELDADRIELTRGQRGGLAGVLDSVRARAEEALGVGVNESQAALARGFVLGQDDRIDAETRDAFKRAGLSHLLAVSGQNVMLLAILAGVILGMFGAALRLRLVLTLLVIAAYVPIAGAGASIERAGVMGAAGILATLAGRPADRAYTALLAACVTLLVNPRFGTDVGWQLSFAAVIGIMLWASPIRALIAAPLAARLPRAVAEPLAEGAALTIAATISTAPLIAHDFERLSLAAVPANLVVLPAIATVMWLGMLIGVLGQLPPIRIGPLDPIAALGWVEGRLVDFVAQVAEVFSAPGWAQVSLPLPGTVEVGVVYAALGLLVAAILALAWRRRGLRMPRLLALGGAAIVLLTLLPAVLPHGSGGGVRPPATLRITALDVGQGDSILLQPPRGAPILVDGGPPGAAAADALRGLGIDRLQAVFVTHDELDHAGGLFEVLGSVQADELVHAMPAPELEAAARASGARVLATAEGGSFEFGRLELDVLWPPRERLENPSENRNFDAIVLAARFGGYDALLSSDAEAEVTQIDPGPLDVLKIAHHGSDDAGLEELLERSVPRVALISVGADNSYGHPTPATIGTLAEHGVCTLRTDLDGAATVELGAAGLDAWTAAGPPPPDRTGCSG